MKLLQIFSESGQTESSQVSYQTYNSFLNKYRTAATQQGSNVIVMDDIKHVSNNPDHMYTLVIKFDGYNQGDPEYGNDFDVIAIGVAQDNGNDEEDFFLSTKSEFINNFEFASGEEERISDKISQLQVERNSEY